MCQHCHVPLRTLAVALCRLPAHTRTPNLNLHCEQDTPGWPRLCRYTARYAIVAMPPHLSGRIVYRPQLPRMRNQLVDRTPMGTTVKVGGQAGCCMQACCGACPGMRSQAAGGWHTHRHNRQQCTTWGRPVMSRNHLAFQLSKPLPQGLHCVGTNTCLAAHPHLLQVLAFYERPFWRSSSNLSESVTFVLDPHAFTPSGDRSIDSV